MATQTLTPAEQARKDLNSMGYFYDPYNDVWGKDGNTLYYKDGDRSYPARRLDEALLGAKQHEEEAQ